ncbi:MAG: DNA polymerase Y family protein [Phycisphaerae bacterium]
MPRMLSVYLPKFAAHLLMRRAQRQSTPTHAAKPRDAARTRDVGKECALASAHAFLLVVHRHSEQLVADCCPVAERAGVRVDMKLAHARSLLAKMSVIEAPYAPQQDAERLLTLARWAQRFSPRVAVDPPDGLLLDLSGGERLFGGPRRYVERIGNAIARLGFPVRLAAAPTIGCAWALARYGADSLALIDERCVPPALAMLPIAALRVDQKVISKLAEVGVECVGEVLRLPRDALAARFGTTLLTRVDQALGRVEEPLDALPPNRPCSVEHVFEAPVTRLEIVLHYARHALAQMLQIIREDGFGARRLDLTWQRLDDAPLHFAQHITHPSHDLAHWWRLLEPRLERANLGYGVEEIHLQASRLQRLHAAQATMWIEPARDAPDAAVLGALIDQLRDRLGETSVTVCEPAESHIPERAFRQVVVRDTTSISARRDGGIVIAARPTHLLPHPEPVQVMALVPDGPPVWMKWRGREMRLSAAAPAERIAFPWWWAARSDNAARDYYRVCDEHGRWLWIFRAQEDARWFVQGEW